MTRNLFAAATAILLAGANRPAADSFPEEPYLTEPAETTGTSGGAAEL